MNPRKQNTIINIAERIGKEIRREIQTQIVV